MPSTFAGNCRLPAGHVHGAFVGTSTIGLVLDTGEPPAVSVGASREGSVNTVS
jgi:hypothetical protein